MAINPRQNLETLMQWQPWPPGDPAPEIWRIIHELDRGLQLRVVDAVLEAQINMANAHVAGLQKIKGLLANAK